MWALGLHKHTHTHCSCTSSIKHTIVHATLPYPHTQTQLAGDLSVRGPLVCHFTHIHRQQYYIINISVQAFIWGIRLPHSNIRDIKMQWDDWILFYVSARFVTFSYYYYMLWSHECDAWAEYFPIATHFTDHIKSILYWI